MVIWQFTALVATGAWLYRLFGTPSAVNAFMHCDALFTTVLEYHKKSELSVYIRGSKRYKKLWCDTSWQLFRADGLVRIWFR